MTFALIIGGLIVLLFVGLLVCAALSNGKD